MFRRNIDLGWEFVRGLPGRGGDAVKVDLPHDFLI